MKNLQLLSRNKTGVKLIANLIVFLLFVFAGWAQTQAQPEEGGGPGTDCCYCWGGWLCPCLCDSSAAYLFFPPSESVSLWGQQSDSLAIKLLNNKEAVSNFNAFKRYLNTLRPEKGSIKNYIDAVDNVRKILTGERLNATAQGRWRGKIRTAFYALDEPTRGKIFTFAQTLPVPPLRKGDLKKLGFTFTGKSRATKGDETRLPGKR